MCVWARERNSKPFPTASRDKASFLFMGTLIYFSVVDKVIKVESDNMKECAPTLVPVLCTLVPWLDRIGYRVDQVWRSFTFSQIYTMNTESRRIIKMFLHSLNQ